MAITYAVRSKNSRVVAFFVFFLLGFLPLALAIRSSISRQNLEIKTHLKKLNRRALKSIKSPDGDIIDCVHVAHQPAFDHPLLKNHTIQMRPTFHREGIHDGIKFSSEPKSISQAWHLKGRCPEGTVPIRRTTKDDVLRASSVQSYGKKRGGNIPKPISVKSDPINNSGHQYAIVYEQGEKYYGARATLNVWKPKVGQRNEFSLAQIWVLGGQFNEDLNSIEAGWQVSPKLYGDNNTRLFTYWTMDGYQSTGCYNLLCSGFVQISHEIALGSSISPLSSDGGKQYEITLLLWKDPKEGNWWLQFGNKDLIGYWPANLFTHLADSATTIEWGGEIVNSNTDGKHTTTQMGSGHFAEEGLGKASFFRNVLTVDGTNTLTVPKNLVTLTDDANCYNLQINKFNNDWGTNFYYGGPGRNPNCP